MLARSWIVVDGSLTLFRLLHGVVGTLGGNMVIRDQAELRQMLQAECERLKLVLRHGESLATESIGYGNQGFLIKKPTHYGGAKKICQQVQTR